MSTEADRAPCSICRRRSRRGRTGTSTATVSTGPLAWATASAKPVRSVCRAATPPIRLTACRSVRLRIFRCSPCLRTTRRSAWTSAFVSTSGPQRHGPTSAPAVDSCGSTRSRASSASRRPECQCGSTTTIIAAGRVHPAYAARSAARSNFFIGRNAWVTRSICSRVPLLSISPISTGVICQERP